MRSFNGITTPPPGPHAGAPAPALRDHSREPSPRRDPKRTVIRRRHQSSASARLKGRRSGQTMAYLGPLRAVAVGLVLLLSAPHAALEAAPAPELQPLMH